jgi:hypothetical protein
MNKLKHPLYIRLKPIAEYFKIGLQMAIGGAIFIYLFHDLVVYIECSVLNPSQCDFSIRLPLAIVGYGLALSAGIELAYMLFTPGPDEAVEPLIHACASAALLALSSDLDSWQAVLTLAVLVASIGGLFWMRREFCLEEEAVSEPGYGDHGASAKQMPPVISQAH